MSDTLCKKNHFLLFSLGCITVSTHMEVHIYSVKAKSEGGTIWVKDIMTTQKGQGCKILSFRSKKIRHFHYCLPLTSPLSAEGPEQFSMLAKRGDIHFFRGGMSKKGVVDFFRGGGGWGFSESNFQLLIKYHIR